MPDGGTSVFSLIGDERFGWSYEKRIAELKKQQESETPGVLRPTHPIKVKGATKYLPMLRIPIELPKYRLANGRTKNTQKEYLATHEDLDRALFTRDEELLEAQIAQHTILLEHADEEGLRDYLLNRMFGKRRPSYSLIGGSC